MQSESTEPPPSPSPTEAPGAAPVTESAPALVFDPEKYRHYVEHFDLSEAQQSELLVALWHIAVQFCDLGVGFHPIQKVMDGLLEIEEPEPRDMVSSKDRRSRKSGELADAPNARPVEEKES